MSRDLFISAPFPSFIEYCAAAGLRFDSEKFLGLKELNRIGTEIDALDSDSILRTMNGILAQYEARESSGYFAPPIADFLKLMVGKYVSDVAGFGEELNSAINDAQQSYEVKITSSDQLRNYTKSLMDTINSCEFMLSVVTPLTLASNQLSFEYGAAMQAKRVIYGARPFKDNYVEFPATQDKGMLIEASNLREATKSFVERTSSS